MGYLSELALVDYHMLKFPSSKIAAAAIYVARDFVLQANCHSYVLEQYTHYSIEVLQLCTKFLTRLFMKAPKARLQAVFKKFSGLRFNEIVKIIYEEWT